jgi:hypothetical protein
MSEYDSDDVYEEYLFDNDNLYQPEEQSLTRYNIILCELYNSKIHGRLENGSKEENIGYLVCSRFKNLDVELIEDIASELVGTYHLSVRRGKHNIYRNYRNIISRTDYFKPEIAQCVYLESQHCVAILKTFWIKLIQRKWKKVFVERKRVFGERCGLKSIKYREIHGKWPPTCNYYPGLKGMLSY